MPKLRHRKNNDLNEFDGHGPALVVVDSADSARPVRCRAGQPPSMSRDMEDRVG
jgi:hypothetical protein